MTIFNIASIPDQSLVGVHVITLSGSLEDHPGLDEIKTVSIEFDFEIISRCLKTTTFLPA